MTTNGWPQVPLGEVITKADDRVPVHADQEYPNFGIYSFGRGLFAKPRICGTSSSAVTLFRARSDQFVYSRLFAFEGAYGVVTRQFHGCFVSNEFPLFDCDPRRLLPDFLGWIFRYREIWADVARLTNGMGNRRQRVHPEALLGYPIPLPPLDEQRRIVAKINRLASKIDEARQTTEQVDSEWRALLCSKFSQIIAGAHRQKIANVAPLVRRKAELRLGEEYPELGIRSFGKGTFHKPPLDYLSVGSKKLYRINPGDLVFNNVFAWEGAIAVAQPDDEGRFGSHRFITCVPQAGVATADFLCFYFSMPVGLERIGEASPGGAGRNRTLGLEKLAEIDVPVPPYEQQLRFGQLLKKVHAMQAARNTASKKLDAFIPSILDRAFRGAL
jgi:type I restriction enzyme S subunit